MAKGTGWAMASVMGSMRVAHLRGQSNPCPICGAPMTVGSMTEQFKCKSDEAADMPEWLAEALKSQGFKPWAFYTQDGAIEVLATAENGAELSGMRAHGGRFGGWQWSKRPEGEITFPDWFPTDARDAYVAERFQQWEADLAKTLEEATTLGLKLCPNCGHGPYSSTHKTPCEGTHPVTHLQKVRWNVDHEVKKREKEGAREAARLTDQAVLDKALVEQGFFRGRKGKAIRPDGSIVLSSDGDRSNPQLFVVAPRITTEQFTALVAAFDDGSEVRMQGRFPVLYTPYPKFWIGRGGQTARALAQALRIKFLKVEKKER